MMHQRTLAVMVVVLLLSAILRFYRLDEQSFWHDEGNSARLSERSIDLIVEGTASDVHPPLYYLILHGWREWAGDTEFGLRSFSAFLGVVLVALTFALGRQLLGPVSHAVPIAGALFAAVNPALIYYSQEARMYELLAFLALSSTLLLVRLLRKPGWSFGTVLAYILTAVAGLYTHYFFPAVLLAHNLIFLSWLVRLFRPVKVKSMEEKVGLANERPQNHDQLGVFGRDKPGNIKNSPSKGFWRDLGVWVAIMLAVFVLYLPWIQIFVRQVGGRPASRPSPLSFLLESGKWMAFGPTIGLDEVVISLIAYTLLFILGIFFGRRVFRGGVSFSITLTLGFLIPVAMMWLTGAIRPAFFKFLLVSVPPLCLLAGSGFAWSWQLSSSRNFRPIGQATAIILLVLVIWGTVRALFNMYFDPAYARADYRAIAAQIADEAYPNAAVILNAANQWEVFTYYHEEGAPVFPIPTAYPDPVEIDAELTDIASRYDRIYAIFWGEAERDPQRLVERWLDDRAFKARDDWISDVRFVTYASPPNAPGEMETPTNLQFGDKITLLGYSLPTDILESGEILSLSLFWQATDQLDERYKVFLHLVDENDQIVAQRDSEPDGNLTPTNIWQPGQIIMDNHGLFIPAGITPGTYTLLLGLYDFADSSDRLPIDAGGELLDSWPVARITVTGE
jgi:hypothetical protein